MEEKKNPDVGRLYGIIGLLVIILVAALILLVLAQKGKKQGQEELDEIKLNFHMERDSLEGELRNIYFRYDTLETSNIEIQKEMLVQQEKIDKLISIQREDAYKIKMYRKEMETIRSVLRSYIVQIDSLNMMNQELMAENKQLKNVERRLTTEKEQLEKDKTQLEEIKDMATTLQASDMEIILLNKKDRAIRNNRLRNAEKVSVTFNIRANKVADKGDRTIYLRIVRDDQVTMGSPELLLFEVAGEQLPASASRVVNYEGTDLPVTLFWDNDGELIPAEYLIELYTGGKLIGTTSIVLN
jgi:hypothetical protein